MKTVEEGQAQELKDRRWCPVNEIDQAGDIDRESA